ncbi:transglutaminase domain-containing protein [Ferruginibacter albus]|uniref:transglutaminase domain-containing protein n=1 Tax=Ferruginibacter albus TaxID=2875540 RepID=UPI001CC5F4F1|nr:transglutaminase domain-containing protein [Ferruginibacter albus]UAY51429.1 hypothetical protein K9M53_12625 [Ferruginibacter albus]
MIQVRKTIIAILFIAVSSSARSQGYKQVDDYVKKLGSLDSMNMGTIANLLTKNFPDKINKTRAIFDWIAFNISYDCKAARNSDNSKTGSEEILKTRMATAFGYAALFQDMCSVAGIRCLTVDGYSKTTTTEDDELPEGFNHSWNVVQLGQSPSEWYYVDPTWGSGYTDNDVKVFTRSFNDKYFFTDNAIFNATHFPDNTAWLLGGARGGQNKKTFFSMPGIKPQAIEFGITGVKPAQSHIKAKVGKPVQFSIDVSNKDAIGIVSLAMGDAKKRKTKQVDYSTAGSSIVFSYKFQEADEFPVSVLFNGKEVIVFWVVVEE